MISRMGRARAHAGLAVTIRSLDIHPGSQKPRQIRMDLPEAKRRRGQRREEEEEEDDF